MRVVRSGKLGPILRPLFGRTMTLVLGQFFLFVDQYLARFQIYDFLLVEVLMLVNHASFVYQAAPRYQGTDRALAFSCAAARDPATGLGVPWSASPESAQQ